MKKKSTSKPLKQTMSKTDWKRLREMKDEDIDMSDIPMLDEHFWKNAKVVMPKKKTSVSLRVDDDMLAWFKSNGAGYQSRMLAVLRSYMQSQR